MIETLRAVFTDKKELLSLLPVCCFAYLYYLTTDLLHLAAALYLIVPAVIVIQHAEHDEYLKMSRTTRGALLSIFFLLPWAFSFLVAPAIVLLIASPRDPAAIILILATIGFPLYTGAHNLVPAVEKP